MRPQHPNILRDLTFICALVLLVFWAMPRTVQGGDAGEFSTILLEGGIPHPPGYPWMRLLWPVSLMIERLGFVPAFSAAFGPSACAVAGFVLLWRAFGTYLSLPLVWTTLFGVAGSGVILRHAYDAEVWGPQIGFASALLALACSQLRLRGWWIAALWGLFIAHHQTAILLAPLIGSAMWSANQRSLLERSTNSQRSRIWSHMSLAAAQLGIGAALCWGMLWTLRWGDGGSFRWGDMSTISGWLHHIFRADFGTFSLGLHDVSPPIFELWKNHLIQLADVWTGTLVANIWIGIAIIALCVYSIWKPTKYLPAMVERGAAASVLLSGLAFRVLHNIDPGSAAGAWILERFDILPVIASTAVVLPRFQQLIEAVPHRLRRLILIALTLVFVVGILHPRRLMSMPRFDRGVETYAHDLCSTPAPETKAIIFGTDDHRTFPQYFIQRNHTYPNCFYVDASLLAYPWYRAQLQTRWPGIPVKDKPIQMILAIREDASFSEHEIYLANIFSRPAASLPRAPVGILWRVELRHETQAMEQIVDAYLRPWSRYRVQRSDFAGLHSPQLHPWSALLWQSYLDGRAQLLKQIPPHHPLAKRILTATEMVDAESSARSPVDP